jgi:hypothetical protein
MIPMQFYFGPNHFNTLRTYSGATLLQIDYNIELEKMVPLGWGIFRLG